MIKIRWRYNEVFKRLKVFMVPDTDGTLKETKPDGTEVVRFTPLAPCR